jgi:hypothetical protein
MQTISLGREPIEDEVNQELESAKEIEVEKKKTGNVNPAWIRKNPIQVMVDWKLLRARWKCTSII